MKTKQIFLTFAMASLLLLSHSVKAQYEQRFSVNLALGVTQASGDMASLFTQGASLSPGIQLNFTGRLSLLARINGYSLGSEEDAYYFDNVNLGAGLKFKITKGRRLIPYIFLLTDLNFATYGYNDEYWAVNEEFSDIGIGITPGAGLELRFSDRFGIFGQVAYNSFLLASNDEFNATTTSMQVGISLSFLKSKEL
ncbi:MAG: hypothetical protein R6U66_09710 [Bacteroidales bacterium]